MANKISTVRTYPLNGAVDFTITFEYLARKFVRVTLIGKDRKELVLNQDYRFTTKTQITTSRAWTAADGYQMIEIRRFTSASDRLVDFADGSILRAYDLNISQVQTLHVAEEARDLTADTIGVNNDGHLDARGRRIVNLANAVDDRDAIPLGQLKTMSSGSWQARNEALQFRNEAETFRNQADGFKNESSTHATNAKQWRDEANEFRNEAEQFKNTSGQYAASAGSYAGNAKDSEDEARRIAESIRAAGLFGYITRQSFEKGFNLTVWNEVLLWEEEGEYYRWDGTLPKNVPAGSTPETSGGVGLGAWVSVGDASLRGELSSNYGAGLIKTTNGNSVQSELDTLRLSDSAEKITDNLSLGSAIVIDSVVSESPFVVPSFATLKGADGFLTGFIGTSYQKNKTIRKSSNTTVTLTNQDHNAGSQTVDAVVYQDPAWPGGTAFPQKSALKHITVEGNSASNPSQAGFFVLQAGVVDIENVDFINCIYAIWAKDIWQSRISRVFSNNGKIRLDNGTSVVLTGCGLASADTTRTGAFDLTGMKYSTLISCTSDHTTNTAYSFDACEGIVLDACGCEGANTTTANAGTALAFKDNNHNIVVNAFTCFPVADQGPALISFGSNNQVTLNSFEVIPGITYNGDIYLYGANTHITINGGRFGSDGNAMPIVTASADAIGSTITYHHRRGITYTYTVTAAGIVTPVQHYRTIVSAIINADGTVRNGFGVNNVTKNSTGSYTINFTSEIATGYAIQHLSSFGFVQVSVFDSTTLTVLFLNPSKTATDTDFSVNITGW